MSKTKLLAILTGIVLIGGFWALQWQRRIQNADIVVVNQTRHRLIGVSVSVSTLRFGYPGALAGGGLGEIGRGGRKYQEFSWMTRPSSYTVTISYHKYRLGVDEGGGSVIVPFLYIDHKPGPVTFRILPGDAVKVEGPVTTSTFLSHADISMGAER